ncbi:oligosaccharyltransferase complex subunit alpha (ribophorin I) [Cryptococcus neoformans Tu259-1]|uniref:Dolichyl-diphosphooligosaccharide--protein glycosyltransferase subunit 1 n=1 Tax=Cryptococcus neoformans Tu259-1 TaxID=1230072 RepID=A0A854Q498_CRYNE|nr:oligosaccharyltransferase complex subunit alpha (ribophorin I) [Cryptococcus neoformans var. grubii Tu259-1]
MLLATAFLLPLALALSPPPQTYVNTAIARTIELGGATAQVTTQYNIKATADEPGEYHLALSGDGDEIPAWWEVAIGGKAVEGIRVLDDRPPTVSVPLGPLKNGDTTTLSLTHVLTHMSKPLPAEIDQREAQYLLFITNSTYVDSWYPTDVERVKYRAPHIILSHTSVPDTYTRDSTVTKAGSSLTLGPFHSLPPTLNKHEFEQQPLSVHYESKQPVIGIKTLKRSAEVSHWGANLNIQDEMSLVNIGPKLKGHFSRLAHQQSRFHASTPPQVLTELPLRIPATAHSAYYYDTIGNVSTSHFRPGSILTQKAKTSKARTSPRTVDGLLELRPRYPLLGGWNYSFVVGYDMPLEDVLKSDQANGKNVLAVPFMTGIKDVVVDDVELKIILPEGAKDVEVYTPFSVDSIEHSLHKTYLDTTGRYAVTLRKARCTENHAKTVYVTYSYPFSALMRKPLTVASVVAGLFLLAMGLRRVSYSIDKQ